MDLLIYCVIAILHTGQLRKYHLSVACCAIAEIAAEACTFVENECSPLMLLLASVNVGIDLGPNQICVCLFVQLCVCVYMAAWQRNTERCHWNDCCVSSILACVCVCVRECV